MTTTTDRKQRLGVLNERIEAETTKAQKAWKAFDTERIKVAEQDLPESSREVRNANRLHNEYEQLAEQVDELKAEREKIWSGLAGGGRGPAGMEEPGAWLSHVVRNAAAFAAVTTDDIGSIIDIGAPFFDRLSKASALMRSGVSVFDIDTSEVKVSRLTGRMTPATPIAELDPIPEEDPPIGHETVKPPKYPKLVTVSDEAFKDARPAMLAATETEMIRAIGTGFDMAAFHGTASPQVGLEHTSGVAELDPQSLTDLDWVVRAKGALERVEGVPTAIYLSPPDAETLGLVKKQTDSNEPLISGERAATDAAAATLLGIPAYVTTGVNEGTAFVAQSPFLVVVRRQDVEVAVDPYYKFAEAGVGVRTIARLYLHVAQPEAVVVVPFTPAPGT